jgi:hypothetical protein
MPSPQLPGQSSGQLPTYSPIMPEQTPSPQNPLGQEPQSAGQVEHDSSPEVQVPSPQVFSMGRSGSDEPDGSSGGESGSDGSTWVCGLDSPSSSTVIAYWLLSSGPNCRSWSVPPHATDASDTARTKATPFARSISLLLVSWVPLAYWQLPVFWISPSVCRTRTNGWGGPFVAECLDSVRRGSAVCRALSRDRRITVRRGAPAYERAPLRGHGGDRQLTRPLRGPARGGVSLPGQPGHRVPLGAAAGPVVPPAPAGARGRRHGEPLTRRGHTRA